VALDAQLPPTSEDSTRGGGRSQREYTSGDQLLYELGQVLLFDAGGSSHHQQMGQHYNPVRQEELLIC